MKYVMLLQGLCAVSPFYESTKNSLTEPGGHDVYDVGRKTFDC